jgi:hypothetical protein
VLTEYAETATTWNITTYSVLEVSALNHTATGSHFGFFHQLLLLQKIIHTKQEHQMQRKIFLKISLCYAYQIKRSVRSQQIG